MNFPDSLKDLRRFDLLNKIDNELNTQIGLEKDEYEVRTSIVLILFNNLLQSLFKSQILTLGIVMIGIICDVFNSIINIFIFINWYCTKFYSRLFYFRELLDLMGIPLDMMTITNCCYNHWYSC